MKKPNKWPERNVLYARYTAKDKPNAKYRIVDLDQDQLRVMKQKTNIMNTQFYLVIPNRIK